MAHYRQGDVLVIEVSEIPATAKELPRDDQNRVILAHGELTGHAHALHGAHVTMYRDGDRDFLAFSDQTDALVHEEHDTITLPGKSSEVRRQVEYHPNAIRRVED